MRIGGEVCGVVGSNLIFGMRAMGCCGSPPPRIGHRQSLHEADERRKSICSFPLPSLWRLSRRTQDDALRHLACRDKLHNAISSLRASATIMVVRFSSATRARNHCTSALSSGGVEVPAELDHAVTCSCIACLRKPLLSPAAATLVGRAGNPHVSSGRSLIPQVAPEHFVHQHICGFDAETPNLSSCKTLALEPCGACFSCIRRASSICLICSLMKRRCAISLVSANVFSGMVHFLRCAS